MFDNAAYKARGAMKFLVFILLMSEIGVGIYYILRDGRYYNKGIYYYYSSTISLYIGYTVVAVFLTWVFGLFLIAICDFLCDVKEIKKSISGEPEGKNIPTDWKTINL